METKITIEALRELANGNIGNAREIMNNEKEIDTMINNLVTKIINKVVDEYDTFKKDILEKPNDYIFDNAYKISSYTDLLYYFENDVFSDFINNFFEYEENNKEMYLKMLSEFSEINILNELYEVHFKYESLTFSSWEQTNEIIRLTIFSLE